MVSRHLARCLPLAEGRVALGHGATLALKDVWLPSGEGRASGITVLPAPFTPQASAGGNPPVNRADMLGVSGFADAQDPIRTDSATAALQELLDNSLYRQGARTLQNRYSLFSFDQYVEQSLSHIERTFLDGWDADRTRQAQEPEKTPSPCPH